MTLSSFLVPRDRIPPLDAMVKRSLSVHDWQIETGTKHFLGNNDKDSGITSAVVRVLRSVSLNSESSTNEKSAALSCNESTV